MRVAVGSTNPVKVEAVRRAWRLVGDAEVIPVSVDPSVSRQPRGIWETYRGALNRAERALAETNADYGVGLEAGIVEAPTPSGWVDVQIAVIVDSRGVVGVGFSPAFEPPREWIGELLGGRELGEIASLYSGRAEIGRVLGVIGYLTRGAVTRLELSYYAVVMALVPLLEKRIYPRGV